ERDAGRDAVPVGGARSVQQVGDWLVDAPPAGPPYDDSRCGDGGLAAPGGWSVILHSNRGGQFVSGDYQRFVSRNTLICSMSAVGHCGENAVCEGFFGMLKRERVSHQLYRTRDEARADLFDSSNGSTTRECDVE